MILGKLEISIENVIQVSAHFEEVSLSPVAKKKMKASHAFIQSELKKGKVIYGVNTGFGLLSNVQISSNQIEDLQVRLLRSHAVGVGDPIEEKYVRAMLFLRAASLAQGYSGVRVELVEQILSLLNHHIHPVVPKQGSVGASGDLAPLSHLAMPLVGEGEVHFQGKRMPAGDALKAAGLKPIRLQAKEGLALINGTQFMTAIAAFMIDEAIYLADIADLTAAMSLEAIRGTVDAFDEKIHAIRPQTGQIEVAKKVRRYLSAGKPSEIAKSHEDCGRVQDPYSFRCVPQVHGTSRDAMNYVKEVVEKEINSVTDNPLVFAKEKQVLSGGNFHGQPISMAMDFLAIAMAELASISEQRIAKLINPVFSELPAFLVKEGGLNSGFMIIQVGAASLVSENKTLSHPAVVDSIPTSADKEDHVSMGAWAARKALMVLNNSRRVLAMELLSAAQGIDLLRPLRSSSILEKNHAVIRSYSRYLDEDRSLSRDIEMTVDKIKEKAFRV